MPPPSAPPLRAKKHGIDLNLRCDCGTAMICRTSTKGQPVNVGRCFFACPNKDMRKPKATPGNGCKKFVWADDIIHSLCSTARQLQQFQIDNINKIDPGLVHKIYPDGIPFLYLETPK
ncbi:hypothetical protein CYMTET_18500 [Cymbomonas tetramitiformis]|uniref:GRF-type domain-containing protein n=1 Tax=Cymbomonas tetramitiformis TaxID=36881 RepID=A0AAE0G7Y0_9CHLO|nr:hypothetical protein CYMTET_18500 [Cymbomonas tetramitiformis]|eukprot:gene27148-33408_t